MRGPQKQLQPPLRQGHDSKFAGSDPAGYLVPGNRLTVKNSQGVAVARCFRGQGINGSGDRQSTKPKVTGSNPVGRAEDLAQRLRSRSAHLNRTPRKGQSDGQSFRILANEPVAGATESFREARLPPSCMAVGFRCRCGPAGQSPFRGVWEVPTRLRSRPSRGRPRDSRER